MVRLRIDWFAENSGLVLQAGAGQLSQTKDNFTTTCNNFLRAENDGCALHVGFD